MILRNLKVKILEESNMNELERKLNDWISENQKARIIDKDVNSASSGTGATYIHMVIWYKDR